LRDNIHAADVARSVWSVTGDPGHGAVFNLGGGVENTCSVLEAIQAAESRLGIEMTVRHESTPRRGDHIAYVTDNTKFRTRYPSWSITRTLGDIYDELTEANQ
jgi:CDP-paratose 2-epimerase